MWAVVPGAIFISLLTWRWLGGHFTNFGSGILAVLILMAVFGLIRLANEWFPREICVSRDGAVVTDGMLSRRYRFNAAVTVESKELGNGECRIAFRRSGDSAELLVVGGPSEVGVLLLTKWKQ